MKWAELLDSFWIWLTVGGGLTVVGGALLFIISSAKKIKRLNIQHLKDIAEVKTSTVSIKITESMNKILEASEKKINEKQEAYLNKVMATVDRLSAKIDSLNEEQGVIIENIGAQRHYPTEAKKRIKGIRNTEAAEEVVIETSLIDKLKKVESKPVEPNIIL